MTWFAASVIVASRKPTGEDDDGPYKAWETVLLIKSDDPDEAVREATEFGQRAAAAQSGDESEGEPPDMEFMGVRYVSEVAFPDGAFKESATATPVEVTYAEMEVAKYADLLKLARGQEVILHYIA